MSITVTRASVGGTVEIAEIEQLASGNIIVGDGSGAPASVALSGDATLAASGALTVAAAVVKDTDSNTFTGNPQIFEGAAAATDVIYARVTADGTPRFVVNADGKLEWGPGNAALDTSLYRDAGNILRTSGLLRVDLDVHARLNAASQVTIGDEGPASEAGIKFGSAGDTNLYRSAADTLRTDDAVVVGGAFSGQGNIALGNTANLFNAVTASTAGTIRYQSDVSGDANRRFLSQADGKLRWGGGTSADDTNLYREAADILATDDKLHVVGELEIDGALNHDGTTVGFFGVTPVTQAAGIANSVTDFTGIETIDKSDVDALGVKVNSIITALEGVGILATV